MCKHFQPGTPKSSKEDKLAIQNNMSTLCTWTPRTHNRNASRTHRHHTLAYIYTYKRTRHTLRATTSANTRSTCCETKINFRSIFLPCDNFLGANAERTVYATTTYLHRSRGALAQCVVPEIHPSIWGGKTPRVIDCAPKRLDGCGLCWSVCEYAPTCSTPGSIQSAMPTQKRVGNIWMAVICVDNDVCLVACYAPAWRRDLWVLCAQRVIWTDIGEMCARLCCLRMLQNS